MFLHPQSFQLGSIRVTQKITNGHKKYYLQSVGLPDEELPLMKENKTTEVKSTWIHKKNQSKDDFKDKKVSHECSEIMDILSLIPPEMLNKRGNGDDMIEEIEEELLNEIQTLNKADSEEGIEEVDEGMDADITPEMNTAEKDMNQAMRNSNGSDTAENITHESEGLEVDGDNRIILHDITSRFLSGQRRKKWKDIHLTPEMLFTDILNNASNIQKLIVKELEMIADVYHEYAGSKMPFKKLDN